jgi:hypothetical protein
VSEAFYIPKDEDRFISTDHTRGPWTPEAQHAGPPSALLGRIIERAGRDDFQVARITLEILGPVPVDELTVRAEIVRPGKNVELVEASLSASDAEVMKARAWLIRRQELAFEAPFVDLSPPPGPENGHDTAELPEVGYLRAMETRFVAGAFSEPGPATAWFRMRHALVEGEDISPLVRVLIAADSGNGISSSIDWSKWFFINTDLSVYLHRMPEGEWVCLDALTVPEQHGIGLAVSTISDQRGTIGRGLQSLYIGPRSGP